MPRLQHFSIVKEICHYLSPFLTVSQVFLSLGRRYFSHKKFGSTIYTTPSNTDPTLASWVPEGHCWPRTSRLTLPPLKSADKLISQPSERPSVPGVCSLPVKRPHSFPVPPSCKSPAPCPGIQFPPAPGSPPPCQGRAAAADLQPQQLLQAGRPQLAGRRAGASSQRWLGRPSPPAPSRPVPPSPLPHFLPSFIPTPKAKVSPAHKPDGGSDVTGHGAARSQSRHSGRRAPANRRGPGGGTSARRKFD